MPAFIWWAALGIYLLGYVLSVRPLAVRTLDNMMRTLEREDELRRREYPNLWASENPKGKRSFDPSDLGRIRATWYALGKSLFWPVVMPVHMVARTVVTPTERQQSEKRELERLRKLAADEGLTWPEGTRD